MWSATSPPRMSISSRRDVPQQHRSGDWRQLFLTPEGEPRSPFSLDGDLPRL